MAPPLNFSVHVNEPELVWPEKPTPKEFKYLSNIDDQSGLRNHILFVHLYPPRATVGAPVQDPIMMIKQSLAKVLAFYYPVARRLRNADKGKLVVDCCGQEVIFRGANADITLAQLCKNGGLKPPFPQWDKLLVDDVWGSNLISNLITNSPLLRVQVTRLACGGFILAYTFNHCICDTYGAYQFITAVSELCKNPNRKTPSSLPAWGRETLRPRSPPIISYPHHEYDDNSGNPTIAYSVSDFGLVW
ncbi:13-hydroxylupanine O-tigloyltransferase [Corylus avellana]|uniref:13-hydroxylupanine O-tigloyltransferase n=1 Tax=Corylus avellana TaxID=13451 RepID=UPI00286A4DA3|nr:13-hydroxylupanine O-tigloyltransferase [Corylus avellana]